MNTKEFVWKLNATAAGAAYYGDALQVAEKLTSGVENAVVRRYLHGTASSMDRTLLQDIAIKLGVA